MIAAYETNDGSIFITDFNTVWDVTGPYRDGEPLSTMAMAIRSNKTWAWTAEMHTYKEGDFDHPETVQIGQWGGPS